MYLGVYSVVLLEYMYSNRTPSVLQWYSDKSEASSKYTLKPQVTADMTWGGYSTGGLAYYSIPTVLCSYSAMYSVRTLWGVGTW